ncbi:MAG TPA: carboxypeptidase regulatory-like domain-containing protein [Rudaea sp.]|jgi:hypothetical protein|uniref:TonB-dependent receptor n=1 Tax=Rudaea sp. TaxID=2136325 RepID=UPI002F95ADC7
MSMTIRAKTLSIAIAALLAATAVDAQNITTSGVNGRVLDASGNPVAGATVTIVHRPSGTTKEVTTDADGRYSAQGLRVGGPFDVRANKGDTRVAEQDDVYLQLGQPASINLAAASATQVKSLDTVVVSANASTMMFAPDNKGLSTTISQRQLDAIPKGNRSIDDVVRLDPRVTVIDQGVGAFSAVGQNNRYNNIAVDGVSQGDPFGLNANGLPYLKTPISPETIAEYNIQTANYDVIADSVGADVNAVTKSGTNEFHGAAYYSYRNADKLVGNAGWLSSSSHNYPYLNYDKDWTGGFNIGGPIIKDKLFFFLSAERERMNGLGVDSANGLDPSLTGASTSGKISPGDLQKVIDTATKLGLIPGTFGGVLGLTFVDKRYLGKIDWNISDNHRASFTAQRTTNVQPAVGGNTTNSVGLSSYTYTKAITTNNYVVHLFDDWTDNFTTEAKIGYQHFIQATTAPFHEPAIAVILAPAPATGPVVNLGEEQFRHYNLIDTKKSSLFLAGTYTIGDHAIKGGLDYTSTKIYNLFGQTEFGRYVFNGIDNFSKGLYTSYSLFHPAPGYTLPDIAGAWTYTQYSPFLQDTWQATEALSLQFGVRVDIPDANRKPVYNAKFAAAFGYPNNNMVSSGDAVIEPRVSFNYNFDSSYKTQLRGGVGLFQSSPPAVWLTNPYQNNGVTVLSYTSFDASKAPFSPDPFNQPIPVGGGAGSVDTVAKNFQLPTVLKTSLALDRELPWWGLIGTAEYEHLQVHNGILYQAINFGAPTGTLPDGRLQFWKTPGEAPKAADSLANQNRAFATSSTRLANTNEGKADTFTLSVNKPFTENLSGNVAVTFSHATDADAGVDTIAFNGYQRVVRVNPNDNVASTSNYNVPRTFKTSLTWQHAFFGDYKSTVSGFYSGRSGNNYTWVFGNDVNGDSLAGFDPVYIPGVNDPKVAYASSVTPTQIQQFQAFLAHDSYLKDHLGQIAGRNGAKNAWINQLDMSFAQEVPGIWGKGELRFDLFNFLNLLNKHWGDTQVVNTTGYPTRTLANYAGVNAKGQYVYTLPTDKNGNYLPQQKVFYDGGFLDPSRTVSRWSAMVTLKYKF